MEDINKQCAFYRETSDPSSFNVLCK